MIRNDRCPSLFHTGLFGEGTMITTTQSESVQCADDLATLAECRLRGNSYLVGTNISCTHQEGALVLSGCLPNYYLWRMAQDIVSEVAGTTQPVVNEIQVLSLHRRHH
jgi:hypothetical protein